MNLPDDFDMHPLDFVKMQQKNDVITHGCDIIVIEPQTHIDELAEMLDRFERTFYEGDEK